MLELLSIVDIYDSHDLQLLHFSLLNLIVSLNGLVIISRKNFNVIKKFVGSGISGRALIEIRSLTITCQLRKDASLIALNCIYLHIRPFQLLI